MAKFLVVLALTSVAAAVNPYGSGIGLGGGLGGIGYGLNSGIGYGGQVDRIGKHYGSSIGGISSVGGFGGLGVGKAISHVGIGTGVGLGPLGIHKGYHGASSIGGVSHLGVAGIGPVGFSKAYHASSIGGHHGHHGFGGGLGVANKAIATSHFSGISPFALGIKSGGIGGLGLGTYGLSGLGLKSISGLNAIKSFSIPGGYYGGILAYPQVIPSAISASALHIPGAAVDAYKGYFGGYFPGSIGYGQSYRFFH